MNFIDIIDLLALRGPLYKMYGQSMLRPDRVPKFWKMLLLPRGLRHSQPPGRGPLDRAALEG
jgi:hypothetical protein